MSSKFYLLYKHLMISSASSRFCGLSEVSRDSGSVRVTHEVSGTFRPHAFQPATLKTSPVYTVSSAGFQCWWSLPLSSKSRLLSAWPWTPVQCPPTLFIKHSTCVFSAKEGHLKHLILWHYYCWLTPPPHYPDPHFSSLWTGITSTWCLLYFSGTWVHCFQLPGNLA